MKTTPVKGTNDYLPNEVALRDYMQTEILKVYKSHGFSRIMTPAIEDAENLDKSDGGENLNLIFKIMKRGDKLTKAIESGNYQDLSDLGLRYDLTLPLSRYYANNKEKLILPMKCIQIDKVYRAERPQKGRLREFVQCDIDILGSDSINCEIELIDVTAKALLAIGMKDFTIKINDRRLLKSMLLNAGFEEDQLDSVCISFDKLDKIGDEGVLAELTEKGFAAEAIAAFENILSKRPFTLETVRSICPDTEIIDNLSTIMNTVTDLANGRFGIDFDLSLVRGQGYYTGTIFEIQSNEFKGSVGGGGRYDNLIGKFLNESVPAVGFSIGFERIFSILSDADYRIPSDKKKVAVLYAPEEFAAANKEAETLRAEYDVALYENPKKTGKFLNKLTEAGFYGYMIYGREEGVKELRS